MSDGRGRLRTDRWYRIALVAHLGSFSHFLMYLVAISSFLTHVDVDGLTAREKCMEGAI